MKSGNGRDPLAEVPVGLAMGCPKINLCVDKISEAIFFLSQSFCSIGVCVCVCLCVDGGGERERVRMCIIKEQDNVNL